MSQRRAKLIANVMRKGLAMAYDLLIRNGRIVDGSGMPAFRGDVSIKDGKIAEIGKLTGTARRTIDAGNRVVAPGLSTTIATTTPRSPGTRCAPIPATTVRRL